LGGGHTVLVPMASAATDEAKLGSLGCIGIARGTSLAPLRTCLGPKGLAGLGSVGSRIGCTSLGRLQRNVSRQILCSEHVHEVIDSGFEGVILGLEVLLDKG
jgi:hypothetical protein